MLRQKKNNPRIAWILVGIWVSITYATLYWARPVCEYLRDKTPLAAIINILLMTVGVGILVFFRKRNVFTSGLRTVLFIVVLILYTFSCYALKHPEERIHFLQYGLLTYLCLNALQFHLRRLPLYFATWGLVSLFGYGDEVIQYFLPNRYFQWQDVGLNSLSALFALALLLILRSASMRKPLP
jgi:VanZ family protein